MDTGKLNEIEAKLLGKLESYCKSGSYWESAERISRIMVNIATLRAIAQGGRVRLAPGGAVVDPPKGRDS